MQSEHDKGNVVGLNIEDGEPIDPQLAGIFDNYSVKRQLINSGYVGTKPANFNKVVGVWLKALQCICLCCRPVIASQLLLVDEVIRAGRNMRKPT